MKNHLTWDARKDPIYLMEPRSKRMTTPTETALHNRRNNISYGEGPVTIIGIATDVPETIIIQPDEELGGGPSLKVSTTITPEGELRYHTEYLKDTNMQPEYIDVNGITTDAQGNMLPGPPLGKTAPTLEGAFLEHKIEQIRKEIAANNRALAWNRKCIKQLRKGNRMLTKLMDTHPPTHQNYGEWVQFSAANKARIVELGRRNKQIQDGTQQLMSDPDFRREVQADKALRTWNQTIDRLRKLGFSVTYTVEDEKTIFDSSLPF